MSTPETIVFEKLEATLQVKLHVNEVGI